MKIYCPRAPAAEKEKREVGGERRPNAMYVLHVASCAAVICSEKNQPYQDPREVAKEAAAQEEDELVVLSWS